MAGTLTKRQKELRTKLMKIRPGATPSEVRARIVELCAQHNYDPIAELIDMVRNGYEVEANGKKVRVPLDAKDVIGIHKEIIQYIAPKLRSVDVQAQVEANISISVTKFSGTPIEGEIIKEEDMIRDVVDSAVEQDLDKMKKPELLDRAKDLGIECDASFTKAMIIEAIKAVEEDDGGEGNSDAPTEDPENPESGDSVEEDPETDGSGDDGKEENAD